MNELDVSAFRALYRQAYERCFGHPIDMPLSETESKAFANKIFDQTGLVIGPKSIKNYSFFILGHPEAKEENPSIATLDTLARYAKDAPYTDETQRKLKENHYPYWFQYKDEFLRSQKAPVPGKRSKLAPFLIAGVTVALIVLLLEDTGFSGKSLRVSLLYNDFYGGFPSSKDIVVQAISSAGKDIDKPEEIAHQLIFKMDPTNEVLISQNLQHSALRIEKREKRLRILYANGSMANSAFKEILSRDIDIHPHYIALFAIRGFVDSTRVLPARFDFFDYRPVSCER